MKKWKRFLLVLVIMALILAQLYIDNNMVEITKLQIVSNKIPESFDAYKILQISDFHSREFPGGNELLVKKIEKINPDIIVFTGDMVMGNEQDFTTFFNLLDQLSGKYQMYFVPGNHEVVLSAKAKQQFLDCFSRNGVTFLDNSSVELVENGEKIKLYGLWYEKKYYQSCELSLEDIQQRIGIANTESYNILLTHQPKYFSLYQSWGADLIFSGHVHGGMVRLPFLGALFSPEGGFLPEYSAGQYDLKDSVLVVSRGLGIGSRGFRLFNRPELVLITLKTT